eukprot:m51a1_g13738 hypothetical protein (731) ;mRNA; f:162346-164959
MAAKPYGTLRPSPPHADGRRAEGEEEEDDMGVDADMDDDDDDDGAADDSEQDLSDLEAEAALGTLSLTETDNAAAMSGTVLQSVSQQVLGGVEDLDAESYVYAGGAIVPVDAVAFATPFGNGLRLFGPDQGTLCHLWGLGWGVGAIASAPGPLASGAGGTRIAYADKGLNPAINVVEYPGFKRVGSARGGTTLEYAGAALSRDGSRLATLGTLPDFRLTIWETDTMESAAAVDRAAAPCCYVSFDPRNASVLCTSGNGSVAFWSAEGDSRATIARIYPSKPGQPKSRPQTAESGISSLTENREEGKPEDGFTVHCWNTDHRVWVGTVGGSVHLIDPQGAAELVTVQCPGNSAITSITLSKTSVIAGTAEGMLHWIGLSGFKVIGSMRLAFANITAIAPDVNFRQMIVGTSDGILSTLPILPPNGMMVPRMIGRFHTSDITGIGSLFKMNAIVSCSLDCTTRVWNYKAKTLPCSSVLKSPVPLTALACGTASPIFVTGSSLGVLRAYLVDADGKDPKLFYRERVHSGPVTHIAFHPTQLYVAVASNNGLLCLLDTTQPRYKVIGYVEMKTDITGLAWNVVEFLNQLFVTTAGGNVYRLVPPERHPSDMMLSSRDVQKSVTKLHWTATAIATDPKASGLGKQFFFVLTEDKKLKRYLMPERTVDPDVAEDVDISQPKEEFRCHDKPGTCLRTSNDGRWLASGGADGTVTLRASDNLKARKGISLLTKTKSPD